MNWRAFVGYWPEDDEAPQEAAHYDQTFSTWIEASQAIAAQLWPFLNDTCQDCKDSGAGAILGLIKAIPDQEWYGFVDGTDYRIEEHHETPQH